MLGNSVQKKAQVGSSGCCWYFSYFSWTPADMKLMGLKFRTAWDAHSVHWLKRDGRSGWHHRGEFKKENQNSTRAMHVLFLSACLNLRWSYEVWCMTRICEDVEVLLLRLQLPIYPRWPCWSLIFHFFVLFSFLRTHYLSRPHWAAAVQRIRALRLFEFTECAQCNLWAAEESCATGLFHQKLITVSCSLFNQWCIMSPSHCEHVQPHRPFRYTCIGPHFGLFAACLSFISPADLHMKLWVKKHIKALWETEPRSVLLPLQASQSEDLICLL